MVVPLPGADSILKWPPTISSRSLMPSNPRRLPPLPVQHAFHLKGFAVVFYFHANAVRQFLDAHSTRLACAWRDTLVSASCATRKSTVRLAMSNCSTPAKTFK